MGEYTAKIEAIERFRRLAEEFEGDLVKRAQDEFCEEREGLNKTLPPDYELTEYKLIRFADENYRMILTIKNRRTRFRVIQNDLPDSFGHKCKELSEKLGFGFALDGGVGYY
jgi:hypothetical protein|tara:strand:- start:638 stop:973 length:336 start_codon:yes stop_codon:yes gene_type:complete